MNVLMTKASENKRFSQQGRTKCIQKIQMLINGQWRDGSEGNSQPLINPATEEVLAHVLHASSGRGSNTGCDEL